MFPVPIEKPRLAARTIAKAPGGLRGPAARPEPPPGAARPAGSPRAPSPAACTNTYMVTCLQHYRSAALRLYANTDLWLLPGSASSSLLRLCGCRLLLGSSGRLTGSLTLCTHRDFCRSALNRVSPKHLGTGGNQKELLLLLLLAATTTPDVLVLPKRRREGEEEEEEVMVVVVLVVVGEEGEWSSPTI